MENLENHFVKIVPVKLLSDRLRIKSFTLVIILLIFAFLLSLNYFLGNIVLLITGILYPALMSISAIHSKEIDDDKQ